MTCRAGRPAISALPAVPWLQPCTPDGRPAECCHIPHPAPRTQRWGSLCLRLLAPTNTGQMRAQPPWGGGHLHARFMHDRRVTRPPAPCVLVQHHTDVTTSGRPGGQASPIRAPPQHVGESRSPQGYVHSEGPSPASVRTPRAGGQGRRREEQHTGRPVRAGRPEPVRVSFRRPRLDIPTTLRPEAASLLLVPKSHEALGSPTEVPVTCLHAPPTATHILDECSKHTP